MRGLLACVAMFLAGLAGAQAPAPAARHQVLEPPQPTARGHVEVLEFFYYGCPVCYEAQPHLARWMRDAGPDVRLRRVPAVSNERWLPLARAYYALEALGEAERLHWPLYDNHHFDGRELDVEANLFAWVFANGVDAERFRAAWNSIDVRQQLAFAGRLGGAHGIRAVPTLVVGGRYVTSARMAGGVKEMVDVLDQLVERVRRERAAK